MDEETRRRGAKPHEDGAGHAREEELRGVDAARILLLLPMLHFSFSALRSQDDPQRATPMGSYKAA